VSEAAAEGEGRPVFSPRTAVAVALAGVFAFSAFVTLLAYAPDLRRDILCRANVYSKCAIGFAGLKALIEEGGEPVFVSRTHLASGRNKGLLIATLEPGSKEDAAGLGFGGPVLIVLPKWSTLPDPTNLAWGGKAGLLPAEAMPDEGLLKPLKVARAKGVAPLILKGAPGSTFEGFAVTTGPIDQAQTIDGAAELTAQGWSPAFVDAAGDPVIVQAPKSMIFVLAEPDLLNTQGLANLSTLTAAVGVLRALRSGEGPFIFDVTLNGYGLDRNVLKLLFDPPFLAVTLCIAAAIALAAWQTLFRFGPVLRPARAYALGKEGLTDNSAELIRLAGREAKMAPRYADLTRKAAAKAVGAPAGLAGDDLTDFLDRLGQGRGLSETLADLSAQAAQVRGRPALAALAQRLYRWRLEMTRERH
jgi:hypothetical protein